MDARVGLVYGKKNSRHYPHRGLEEAVKGYQSLDYTNEDVLLQIGFTDASASQHLGTYCTARLGTHILGHFPRSKAAHFGTPAYALTLQDHVGSFKEGSKLFT